ncbi:hypothetical protein VaNZ11_002393 [Volvox africanus]|uniref:Protein kinase domain-containing protein n=1 Tax=Volvox africanus TaxID=51714 RepID=A0ABQ5RSU7_9CHLO|nr:hypothetical protein VaNZ11_002393 [Volvox africanus]
MQNYEYISTLGEGTYGQVWKCREKESGRLVAVKAFKEAHLDLVTLKLAVREAKVLNGINHPNIVRMIASYKSKSGRLYLVLEYVETSLHSHLQRFPRGLPAMLTKILCWQLLYAVAYLHEKNILHRDIKPDNILVTKEGVLKLCDFGFARYTSCGPRYVQHGTQYITTRWYRAPEVLIGDKYGPSSDIWSVGCTIAEIATGRPLFPGHSSADQLWRVVRCLGPLPPGQAAVVASIPELHNVVSSAPTTINKTLRHHLPADLDPHLFRLVESCLQLDPMKRPTAQQVLQWPYFGDVGRCLAEAAQRDLTAASSREVAPASAVAAAASDVGSAIPRWRQVTATNNRAARRVATAVALAHEDDGCNSIEQQCLELAPPCSSSSSSSSNTTRSGGGGAPSLKVVLNVQEVMTVAAPAAKQVAQVPLFKSYVTPTARMSTAATTTTTAEGAVSDLQQFCRMSTRKKPCAWVTAAARRSSAEAALTSIIDSCVINPDAAASPGTLIAVDNSIQEQVIKNDPSRALMVPLSFATQPHELDQQKLNMVESGTNTSVDDGVVSHCSCQRCSSSVSQLLPSLTSRQGLTLTSLGHPFERVTFSGSSCFLPLQSNTIDTQQLNRVGGRASSSHHHVSATTTTTTASVVVDTTTSISEAVARNDGSHHGASNSYLATNSAVPSLLNIQSAVAGGGQGPSTTVSTRCLSAAGAASLGLDDEAARKVVIMASSRNTTPRPLVTGGPQSCDQGVIIRSETILTTAGGSSSTLARGDPAGLSSIRTRHHVTRTSTAALSSGEAITPMGAPTAVRLPRVLSMHRLKQPFVKRAGQRQHTAISAVFCSDSGRNSYCSDDSRSGSSSFAGFKRTCSVVTGGLSRAFSVVDEVDESDWCGNNAKCGNLGSSHVVAATERQSTAEGQRRARLQHLGSGRLGNGLQSAATRVLNFFGYRGSTKSNMKLAVPGSAATRRP